MDTSSSTKWAHISDVHLDFLQYNLEERREDFYKSWMWSIEKCIEEKVNFVVIAGDLFHNRQARHVAIKHAIDGLELLKQNSIPAYAVIGNHELKKYRERLSAPTLLDSQGYLTLIESNLNQHVVVNDCVIWGLDWRGAKTDKETLDFCEFIKNNQEGISDNYQILVLHCGLAEEASEFDSSVFSYSSLKEVHGIIDYVALGHIHRPYSYQENDGPLVINPGSLETNSFTEAHKDWSKRGFYINEIVGKSLRESTLYIPPRRDFLSLDLDISSCSNNREAGESILAQLPISQSTPIFRIVLTGSIDFDVDRQYLESLLPENYCLNNGVVKDKTTSVEFQVVAEENSHIGTDEVEVTAIKTRLPEYTVDYTRRIIELANNRVPIKNIIEEL